MSLFQKNPKSTRGGGFFLYSSVIVFLLPVRCSYEERSWYEEYTILLERLQCQAQLLMPFRWIWRDEEAPERAVTQRK